MLKFFRKIKIKMENLPSLKNINLILKFFEIKNKRKLNIITKKIIFTINY